MPDLRIAIIGYGLAGRFFHAPLISATAGMTVAAVVTSHAGRASSAALELPEAEILRAPEDVWARAGALDAVVVATANDAHVPLARAAVDHALAVVVDKPLATDADQAAELVGHAQRADVLLTVFQNRRWDAEQRLLTQLLAAESLGTVLRCESRMERWRPAPDPGAWRISTPAARGGGVLLDLGAHLVDEVLTHFGPIDRVYAEIAARHGHAADDDVFLALAHRGGVISHLYASTVAAAPSPRLRVLGTEAALVVSTPDGQEARLRAGERPDVVGDWGVDAGPNRPRLVAGERSVPLNGPAGDWPAFYAQWGRALRGEGPVPVDPEDAVAALRVLDAARRSAASGSVVDLSEPPR